MRRVLSAAEAASLPEDLLVSVDGISRALPPPMKGMPRWLARVLPKSGLAGRTGPELDDMLMDDDDEDDDDDDYRALGTSPRGGASVMAWRSNRLRDAAEAADP